jgi:hypothetical protein
MIDHCSSSDDFKSIPLAHALISAVQPQDSIDYARELVASVDEMEANMCRAKFTQAFMEKFPNASMLSRDGQTTGVFIPNVMNPENVRADIEGIGGRILTLEVVPKSEPVISTVESVQLIDPAIESVQPIEPVIEPIQLIEPVIESVQLIKPVIKPVQLIKPVVEPVQLNEPVVKPVVKPLSLKVEPVEATTDYQRSLLDKFHQRLASLA